CCFTYFAANPFIISGRVLLVSTAAYFLAMGIRYMVAPHRHGHGDLEVLGALEALFAIGIAIGGWPQTAERRRLPREIAAHAQSLPRRRGFRIATVVLRDGRRVTDVRVRPIGYVLPATG